MRIANRWLSNLFLVHILTNIALQHKLSVIRLISVFTWLMVMTYYKIKISTQWPKSKHSFLKKPYCNSSLAIRLFWMDENTQVSNFCISILLRKLYIFDISTKILFRLVEHCTYLKLTYFLLENCSQVANSVIFYLSVKRLRDYDSLCCAKLVAAKYKNKQNLAK